MKRTRRKAILEQHQSDIEMAKVIASLFSSAVTLPPSVTMAQHVSAPTTESKKRKIMEMLKELITLGEEEETKPSLTRDDVHGIAVAAIRADPRTEEFKLAKAAMDKQAKQIDSMQQVLIQNQALAKEDKDLEDRILREATDMKIKTHQLEESIEPLAKRMTNFEAQQKALQGRINAMEDRIRAVEMK